MCICRMYEWKWYIVKIYRYIWTMKLWRKGRKREWSALQLTVCYQSIELLTSIDFANRNTLHSSRFDYAIMSNWMFQTVYICANMCMYAYVCMCKCMYVSKIQEIFIRLNSLCHTNAWCTMYDYNYQSYNTIFIIYMFWVNAFKLLLLSLYAFLFFFLFLFSLVYSVYLKIISSHFVLLVPMKISERLCNFFSRRIIYSFTIQKVNTSPHSLLIVEWILL